MRTGIKCLGRFAVHKRGSLLIEAIFSLWILVCIFLLLEFFMLVLAKGEESLQANQVNREFELFAEQLEAELYRANFSRLEVRGGKLLFTDADGARVSYERSGGRIRRKLNGRGNDIVLLAAQDFRAEWDAARKRLEIEVKFNEQEICRVEISYTGT